MSKKWEDLNKIEDWGLQHLDSALFANTFELREEVTQHKINVQQLQAALRRRTGGAWLRPTPHTDSPLNFLNLNQATVM